MNPERMSPAEQVDFWESRAAASAVRAVTDPSSVERYLAKLDADYCRARANRLRAQQPS